MKEMLPIKNKVYFPLEHIKAKGFMLYSDRSIQMKYMAHAESLWSLIDEVKISKEDYKKATRFWFPKRLKTLYFKYKHLT